MTHRLPQRSLVQRTFITMLQADALIMTAMVYITSILFGIHMIISSYTLYRVLKPCKQRQDSLRHALFVGALVILSATNFAIYIANSIPAQSRTSRTALPAFATALDWRLVRSTECTSLLITLLCHIFLMYRCYVIWNKSKAVMVLPGILLLFIVAYGLFVICRSSLFVPFDFEHLFYAPTLLILNVTLSSLICGRIIWCKTRVCKLLGERFRWKGCIANAVVIIVESSLIYTIATAFHQLLPYSIQLQGQYFCTIITQLECIASELIVLRVVCGRDATQEWSTIASNQAPSTALDFGSQSTSDSQALVSCQDQSKSVV